MKSKITGIEMFHKSLEEGHAGDQVRSVFFSENLICLMSDKESTMKLCNSVFERVYFLPAVRIRFNSLLMHVAISSSDGHSDARD